VGMGLSPEAISILTPSLSLKERVKITRRKE
jgi:hypothetical protein